MNHQHKLERSLVVETTGQHCRLILLNKSRVSGLWGCNNVHNGSQKKIDHLLAKYLEHFKATGQPHQVHQLTPQRLTHWQAAVNNYAQALAKNEPIATR